MSTFRGEVINQRLPTSIVISDGVTTLTIDPTTSTSGNSGSVGVVDVDHGRVVKHNHDITSSGLDDYPVFSAGDVTVTIDKSETDLNDNVVDTRVVYTLNGRNPTSKATKATTAHAAAMNTRVNSYRDGAARVYEDPFIIENSRPGSDLCTLRIRAYKVASQEVGGTTITGVSPNEKSKVLIVRFVLKNASFTLPTNR